ncbi:Ras guanine nucleotide exchange factor M [Smittium mucronatum]|uniref:Ras guanine nucleotide exchange factor M n=1 Tax=Smittium mucronatum TaxID=133383 RepID=A0A1R0H3D5_9FUNG|nr:Ras guanine nucleotide exchange factor M [Smittium mucronatum]
MTSPTPIPFPLHQVSIDQIQKSPNLDLEGSSLSYGSPINETLNLYNIDSIGYGSTKNNVLESPQIPADPSHFLMKSSIPKNRVNPSIPNPIASTLTIQEFQQKIISNHHEFPKKVVSSANINKKALKNAYHIDKIHPNLSNTNIRQDNLSSDSSEPESSFSCYLKPNTNFDLDSSTTSKVDTSDTSEMISFPSLNSDNTENLDIYNKYLFATSIKPLSNPGKKKFLPYSISTYDFSKVHDNPSNNRHDYPISILTEGITKSGFNPVNDPNTACFESDLFKTPPKQTVKVMGMLKLPEEYCRDIFSALNPRFCSLLGIICHKSHTPLNTFLNTEYPPKSLYNCCPYRSQIDIFMFKNLYQSKVYPWPLNSNSLSADIFLGSQINLLQKRAGKFVTEKGLSSYRELLFSKSKGLSLWALIISLTDKNCAPNTSMINKSLCTYRFFSSSLDFLRLLIVRYINTTVELKDKSGVNQSSGTSPSPFNSNIYGDMNLSPSQASNVIQLRVINVIKIWVKMYKDDFDECLLSKTLLLEFLEYVKSNKDREELASNIEIRLNSNTFQSPFYQTFDIMESAKNITSASITTPLTNTPTLHQYNFPFDETIGPNQFNEVLDQRKTLVPNIQSLTHKTLEKKFSLGSLKSHGQTVSNHKSLGSKDKIKTNSVSKKLSKKISSSYLVSLFQSKQKRSSLESNDIPNDELIDGPISANDHLISKQKSLGLEFSDSSNLIEPYELCHNPSDLNKNRRTLNSQLSDDMGTKKFSIQRDSTGSIMEYYSFSQGLISESNNPIFGSTKKRSFESNSKLSKITDFDPGFIAEQLTLIEHSIYAKIRPKDIFMRLRTKGRGSKTFSSFSSNSSDSIEISKFPEDFDSSTSKFSESINLENLNLNPISSLAHWSNCTTYWVVYSVLSESNPVVRASIIVHITLIAYHCLALRNYNGAFELTGGLTNSSIRRLKDTWSYVPQEFKLIIEQIQEVWQSRPNHKLYRESFVAALNGTLGPDQNVAFDNVPSSLSSNPIDENKKLSKFGSSTTSRSNSISGVRYFFGLGSQVKDKSNTASKQDIPQLNPNENNHKLNNIGFSSNFISSQMPTASFYQPISGSDTTLFESDAIVGMIHKSSTDRRSNLALDPLDTNTINKRDSSDIFKRALSEANIDYFYRALLVRNPSSSENFGSFSQYTAGDVFSKNNKLKSKSLQPGRLEDITVSSGGNNIIFNHSLRQTESNRVQNSDKNFSSNYDQNSQFTNSISGRKSNGTGNYERERSQTNSKLLQYPVVPFFGLHMTDLLHADEANQTYIKISDSENFSSLLNFKNNWSKLPKPDETKKISSKSSLQNLKADRKVDASFSPTKYRQLKNVSSVSNLSGSIKNSSSNPVIMNMTKFRILSNILMEIKQSQSLGFSCAPNIEMQNWLKKTILNFEEHISELSKQIDISRNSEVGEGKPLSPQYFNEDLETDNDTGSIKNKQFLNDSFNEFSDSKSIRSSFKNVKDSSSENSSTFEVEPNSEALKLSDTFESCNLKQERLNDQNFSKFYLQKSSPVYEKVSNSSIESKTLKSKLSNYRLNDISIRKIQSQNVREVSLNDSNNKKSGITNSISYSNVLESELRDRSKPAGSVSTATGSDEVKNKATTARKNSTAADLENILYNISKKIEP